MVSTAPPRSRQNSQLPDWSNVAQIDDYTALHRTLETLRTLHQLLSSRPAGKVRPVLTPGHVHLAKVGCQDITADINTFFGQEAVVIVAAAQRAARSEMHCRSVGDPLPAQFPHLQSLASLVSKTRQLTDFALVSMRRTEVPELPKRA